MHANEPRKTIFLGNPDTSPTLQDRRPIHCSLSTELRRRYRAPQYHRRLLQVSLL